MITKEAFKSLIDLITSRLDELTEAKVNDEFIEGQKTAYVEILEVIQSLDLLNELNLDFDIEAKYPLM